MKLLCKFELSSKLITKHKKPASKKSKTLRNKNSKTTRNIKKTIFNQKQQITNNPINHNKNASQNKKKSTIEPAGGAISAHTVHRGELAGPHR